MTKTLKHTRPLLKLKIRRLLTSSTQKKANTVLPSGVKEALMLMGVRTQGGEAVWPQGGAEDMAR